MDKLNTEGYYAFLVHGYLSGQATDEETKELMEWLKLSDEHRIKFEDIRKVMELSIISGIPGKFEDNRQIAWKKLSEKIK